jgi:hypothetical protein
MNRISPQRLDRTEPILGSTRRGWSRLRFLADLSGIYLCGSGSYELCHLLRNGRHFPTYWENFSFSLPAATVAGIP